MFSNLKLGARLALGFALVLVILVGLGLTGYVMFSKVDTNVADLGKNNLPSVKFSTGVERDAFKCILDEKNYLINEKEESHQSVKTNLGSLNKNLDEVDKVAKEFANAELEKKSAEVRKIAGNYGTLFDEGVNALKANVTGSATLTEKGGIVGKEAEGYMASKKTEYNESKDALAVVNDIKAGALETRMNEKAYMLYKESKYFDAIEKNIAALLKDYDQLEKYHPNAEELKQISDARKSTQDYFEAAKKWVALEKGTVAATLEMNTKWDKVIAVGNDYLAAKEKAYREMQASATANKGDIPKIFDALIVGNRIPDLANETMIYSKKYMLERKEGDWKQIVASVDELNGVYKKLRELSTGDADIKAIESAEKATAEYLVAAKVWVENDNQMLAAAKAMDNGGNTVGNAAVQYLVAKQAITDKVASAVFIVASIAQEALTIRLAARRYMMSKNLVDWNLANEHMKTLDGLYGDLKKVSITKDDLERIDRADKATGEYQTAMTAWYNNDKNLKEKILPAMKTSGEAVLATAQSAESDAWTKADKSNEAVIGVVGSSKFIIVLVLIIGTIAGVLAAFVITKSITGPLNRIIAGLNASAEQVGDASGQVAGSSQAMAEGASEQASSLEETSASLEEMSSMTKQNAENARQANGMSTSARNAAEKGREAMTRMADAINDIKKSSDQTAKIIKTIDEIAFQTNLLALNAAVEAARAGEAGKGFAVVAEEVRNLAQRSAEAAKNTAALIEQSQKNSENGVAVSNEVATILKDIYEAAAKVTQLNGEVSAATDEQSKGIEQVNLAVSEMDKVTQSNAANAEESAAASEELSAQARELLSMVGELIALVGRAETAGQDGQGPLMRPPTRMAHREEQHHLPAPKDTKARPRVQQALAHTHNGHGNGHDEAPNRLQKTGKASQVIPLSDSELGGF